MSDDIDPSGTLPRGWHVDSYGNFHWGSPGQHAEASRQAGVAAEKAADEHAANVSYENGKEVGRQEAGQDYRDRLQGAITPPEPASDNPTRSLGENTPLPEPVQEAPTTTPDRSPER